MNEVDLIPEEIEKDRLQRAAELAEDGKDWAEDYKPGSFGCHELLDRTAMFAAMVEQEIQSHPACIANPEWFLLAEQASAALRELYQKIGAEHLSVEDAGG
jgi:hypothetical protein